MSSQFPPHVQRVYDALVQRYSESKIDLKVPGQFRSPCPAHDGSKSSMVTYYIGDTVRFQCYSEGCTHAEIREALGLPEQKLRLEKFNGCTLEQYAEFKQLPIESLLDCGLSDSKFGSKPAVKMPYFDSKGKNVSLRLRVSTDGELKVRSQRGAEVRLYGIWKLEEAVSEKVLVIVEGESDAQTLWYHSIPAVGIPGAQQVNVVMPDLATFLSREKEVTVFVIQEPDHGGQDFIRHFGKSQFRDRIRVIRLDGFKDPSEMHCNVPSKFLARWQKAVASSIPLNQALTETGFHELSDLAASVGQIMSSGTGRQPKQQLCELVGDFLVSRERLLSAEFDEVRDRVPYILIEGTPQPLESDSLPVRMALQDLGLNPVEPVFIWLVRYLQKRAVTDGKLVRVHRFSRWQDGKLYMSCGRRHLVVAELDGAEEVRLTKQVNGHDGVLFGGGSCFPEWEPCEGEVPAVAPVFIPRTEAPPEAPRYSLFRQAQLLEAWMVCVFAGELAPILAALGSYGSGKSLTLEAAVRLFMCDSQTVSQAPSDARSFFSIASSTPIFVIDNLDSHPPAWLEDSLAQAATGGDFASRKQYSNSEVYRTRLRAKIGITSRTADFAKRKDIKDRLLPLFFTSMEPESRKDRLDLLGQVDENRDSILSHLAEVAVLASRRDRKIPVLPTRFQEFGRILYEICKKSWAVGVLTALETAQQLAIRDPDPLTRALIEFDGELRGTASQIMETLSRAGFRGIPTGGGKSVAARLRECASSLRLSGRNFREDQKGSNTVFTIGAKRLN